MDLGGDREYDVSMRKAVIYAFSLLVLVCVSYIGAYLLLGGEAHCEEPALVAPLDPLEQKALVRWAVAAMRKAEPKAPWADTYEATATAVALEAHANPVYPRAQDGVRRTMALVLGIAFYESNFRPDAEGDCRKKDGGTIASVSGRCKDSTASSLCLLQVSSGNLKGLGLTREEILRDTRVCVRAGLRLVHVSMGVCRAKAYEDRLAQYAHGGDTCGGAKGEGIMESRHRVAKAKWFFGNAELKAVYEHESAEE